MTNITSFFSDIYLPKKALLIYEKQPGGTAGTYIESYDISGTGEPCNAHPLSENECSSLAEALHSNGNQYAQFLKPAGLLPLNVIYLHTYRRGFAIWFTPAMKANLLFAPGLDLANGEARIPPLLWKASKDSLYIYALKDEKHITLTSGLYHAPFFNIYKDGRVCMGTVENSIDADADLETFIREWQQSFFNSRFSHTLDNFSPVKKNLIQLWKKQLNSGQTFPLEELVKANKLVSNLLQ